jgi:transposase
MKAYSEDLRRKIVDAIGRDMPKAEAARTFGISTLKRYATKARRGEPLEPGKAPGKRPKMDERIGKLLEEDLKERPFATLRERCEYVEAVSGVSASRSTMWRAIVRIGPTRKKGASATGRDEFLRAAWLLMVAADVATSIGWFSWRRSEYIPRLRPFTVTPRRVSACAFRSGATAARTRRFWPRSPSAGWARRWPWRAPPTEESSRPT